MNVTENFVIIKDLTVGEMYHIFVVARNSHGTSLPSSVLIITIRKSGKISRKPSDQYNISAVFCFLVESRV